MIHLGKRSISNLPDQSGTTSSSIARAVQTFLLERRIAGATATTVAMYRAQLDPFVHWCAAAELDEHGAGIDDLRAYLAVRQRVSSSALFEAARRIKTFFRWCHQEHICDDIAARIRLPKQKRKIIPALTEPQVRALLGVCSKDTFVGRRDEALLRLLARLRPSCIGLRVSAFVYPKR